MNTDLASYYHQRAAEYEKIYAKPERQNDLLEITDILQKIFAEKEVLEIACGTGYWTERIAQTASSVLATDLNPSVLEIAKAKKYTKAEVIFETVDLYQFQAIKQYESLLGGFIWSHILLQDLDTFIHKVKGFVKASGTKVFIDNKYVLGSNHPISHTDEQGNTFQTRRLEDGSEHLVLKNFPTESFLKEKLKNVSAQIEVIELQYYWILIWR